MAKIHVYVADQDYDLFKKQVERLAELYAQQGRDVHNPKYHGVVSTSAVIQMAVQSMLVVLEREQGES